MPVLILFFLMATSLFAVDYYEVIIELANGRILLGHYPLQSIDICYREAAKMTLAICGSLAGMYAQNYVIKKNINNSMIDTKKTLDKLQLFHNIYFKAIILAGLSITAIYFTISDTYHSMNISGKTSTVENCAWLGLFLSAIGAQAHFIMSQYRDSVASSHRPFKPPQAPDA